MNKTLISANNLDDYPNIHLQNMKDELFMMKYGYWVKIKDQLEELDKDYEFKKWKQFQQNPRNQQNNYIEFKYESKSKYPDIVLQKNDDPPHFNFDNIEYLDNQYGSCSIFDKNDNNRINYAHISYIIDYQPNSKHNHMDYLNIGYSKIEPLTYDLLDKQLENRIRSLEAMIYLFESCYN